MKTTIRFPGLNFPALGSAAVVLALLAAGPLRSQSVPESLSRAWLREVLDLDTAGAVASYQQIVDHRSSAPTDRWIASARLLELRSIGVARDATVQPADLPQLLQDRIREDAASEQVTRDRLRSQADRAPEQLQAAIRADRKTTLRPFVGLSMVLALEELRPNNPALARRMQAERRGRPERNRIPTRMMQEFNAANVLRAELAGQGSRADALRTYHFADWRPPALPANSAAALQTVRTNLDQWRRERQLTRDQQENLGRLSSALDLAASRSPDDALRLLQRLPVYAERLLGTGAAAAQIDPSAGQGR